MEKVVVGQQAHVGRSVPRGALTAVLSVMTVALLAACGGSGDSASAGDAKVASTHKSIKAVSTGAEFNYSEALQKSIFFYEAQQSGKLPSWNRVSWRGDSRTTDGSDVGLDLTGGWYDAGDHIKFGFPMAWSATELAWGVIEFEQGYKDSGQYDAILRNLRFVNDYFIKAHPSPNVFYAQVGNGGIDHSWWGPVEVYPKAAPAYKIDSSCGGSDIAAETAAAMAASSILFKTSDPAYAETLLTHAKQLYNFADTTRAKYSDCVTAAKGFYDSWSGYTDELAWGAAWLYRATGDAAYLAKAEAAYDQFGTDGQTPYHPYKWTHDWDNKYYGTYVLLAKLTGKQKYADDIERNLNYWTTGVPETGERITYTPGGLAWLEQWGSLRCAMDESFLAMVYSKNITDTAKQSKYRNFAMSQLNYVLGDNPRKGSFVVGFGANSPAHPHHRTSHGSWTDSMTNPVNHRHTLYGAMVGGPGSDDGYTDDISNYTVNEVATDYNAGFTGVLAAAVELFPGTKPLADFPQKEVASEDEFFVEASINSSGNNYTEIKALLNNRSGWPARNGTKLSLRYFVDLSEVVAAGKDASAVKLSSNYMEGGTLKGLTRCGTSNIYYATVDFSGTNIYPGGQSAYKKEAQFRFSAPDATSYWNPANDPSYKNLTASSTIKTVAIPVYDDGKLIFGVEPSACSGVAPVLPATPASVAATGGASKIALSWTAVSGASSYTIKRSASGTAGTFSRLGTSAVNSYTDTALPSNTTYYYVVSASNDAGDSADSTVVSAKTDAVAPGTPAPSVTAGDGQVVLSWAAVSDAVSYDVQRASSATGTYTTVATGLTTPGYTDKSVVNGTTYWYKVVASNSVGATSSTALSATPQAASSLPAATTVGAVAGDAKVSLSWTAVSGATGYTVQRAASQTGTYADVATVVVSATSYVDTTVANGTTYWYRVVATNAVGSTPSTAVSATPVSATQTGACTLTLDTSNDWGAGQVMTVKLANTGTTPISNWKVTWTESNDISVGNFWSSTVTVSGRVVTVTPAGWNSTIGANSSAESGMQIAYSGAKPVPTNAVVEGQACTIVVR